MSEANDNPRDLRIMLSDAVNIVDGLLYGDTGTIEPEFRFTLDAWVLKVRQQIGYPRP